MKASGKKGENEMSESSTQKNKIREPLGDRILKVVVVLLVVLLTLCCILPILNIAATSFSSARAITSNEVVFLPVEFSLDAYKTVFSSGPLLKSMAYSILITLLPKSL